MPSNGFGWLWNALLETEISLLMALLISGLFGFLCCFEFPQWPMVVPSAVAMTSGAFVKLKI